MYKYKLILAYDGTKYSGWQIQKQGLAIQEVLQDTLKQFLQEEIKVTGSGRTDAGVHAKGQAAHFTVSRELETYRFMAAANGLLPPDIRVKSITKAHEDFHARYSAIKKTYHYHLFLEPVMDPFKRLYVAHVRDSLDLKLLEKAAKEFEGTKDFTSFSNSPQEGSVAKNPVRTLYRCEVHLEPGNCRIELEANGFLYKMVRNIVGMCLDVARGKRALDEISKVLDAKDRREAARAAPAQGLFLTEVSYPREIL